MIIITAIIVGSTLGGSTVIVISFAVPSAMLAPLVAVEADFAYAVA